MYNLLIKAGALILTKHLGMKQGPKEKDEIINRKRIIHIWNIEGERL